jgi:galactokinase
MYVIEENLRVENACIALQKVDFKTFGELMYKSHEGLQHMYEVSCPELDFLVDSTRNNKDVLGARMMGGGFGGCTINLVKNSAVDNFISLIAPLYKEKCGKDMKAYVVKIGTGARIE